MSRQLLDWESAKAEAAIGEKIAALKDMVNHPAHYNMTKYETIDIIEDANLPYHLSAALKYLLRCQYKDKTDEDLAKAVWYIERYRKLLRDKNSVSELSGIEGDS